MLISFLRTVVLYLLLIVTVRLMGKRQIGEMEPAEFVVTMLLALSLLCGMLTQRSTRDAAAALELALDALDRDETAQAVEAGAQARQHWQRHRRFLCAVLSHDELDGIEQGFAELRAYSAVGDAAELRSRCEVLLLQLQHIAQLDAPYAENFLTCPVRI